MLTASKLRQVGLCRESAIVSTPSVGSEASWRGVAAHRALELIVGGQKDNDVVRRLVVEFGVGRNEAGALVSRVRAVMEHFGISELLEVNRVEVCTEREIAVRADGTVCQRGDPNAVIGGRVDLYLVHGSSATAYDLKTGSGTGDYEQQLVAYGVLILCAHDAISHVNALAVSENGEVLQCVTVARDEVPSFLDTITAMRAEIGTGRFTIGAWCAHCNPHRCPAWLERVRLLAGDSSWADVSVPDTDDPEVVEGMRVRLASALRNVAVLQNAIEGVQTVAKEFAGRFGDIPVDDKLWGVTAYTEEVLRAERALPLLVERYGAERVGAALGTLSKAALTRANLLTDVEPVLRENGAYERLAKSRAGFRRAQRKTQNAEPL